MLDISQFQRVTAPLGLLGCPTSLQRLMESVIKGLDNTIVNIDKILAHHNSHNQHLKVFNELLGHFQQHCIKILLNQCSFGSKPAEYLGFYLTEKGIQLGKDKMKAIKEVATPGNVYKLCQVLWLCQFLKDHIKNLATVSATDIAFGEEVPYQKMH